MITRVRGGGQVEMRSFALTDMVRYGYDGLRGFSGVGEKEVRGIPALHRAARLRAEALASLRLRCWSGDGADRVRRDNVWQSQLFAGPANEYQSRFLFWETVGESLAWRNNAYVWKNVDPLTGRITDWWALHPDQVSCKGADAYTVTVKGGWLDPVGHGVGSYHVDGETILHIRGHGQGGTYEAPTPIQVFRDALAAPVERQRHEARMWRRGTAVQQAIVWEKGISRAQTEEWRDGWKSAMEGTSGDTTAVLGGGATLQPIGMTVADSKFVEMANLTVEDASRIMGVPANLLGTQLKNSVPKLEQDLASWLRFGLGPDLERIESVVGADEELFPAGAHTYPKFDTDMFVRGDLQTEATVLVGLVQAGILLPDEARRIRGLDDLPDGLGKIPQITPVGGAPNALTTPAPAASSGDPNGENAS